MKEKILESFSELGFKLEEDGGVHSFKYEGINMLLILNEKDEDFLSISIPCLYEAQDEDEHNVAVAVAEKINSTLKYVKAYLLGENLWVFYERELIDEEENLTKAITHMIYHLEAAVAFALKTIKEMETSSTEDSTDDGTEEIEADEMMEDIDEDFSENNENDR